MITAEHNELIRVTKKKVNSNWTFSDQFVRSLNRSKFLLKVILIKKFNGIMKALQHLILGCIFYYKTANSK